MCVRAARALRVRLPPLAVVVVVAREDGKEEFRHGDLDLLPKLFGAPLMTFNLYQPDMVILLVASSVTGVSFAVFRLAVAYTGRQAG